VIGGGKRVEKGGYNLGGGERVGVSLFACFVVGLRTCTRVMSGGRGEDAKGQVWREKIHCKIARSTESALASRDAYCKFAPSQSNCSLPFTYLISLS